MSAIAFVSSRSRRWLASSLFIGSLLACGDEAPGADFPKLHNLTSAPAIIRTAAKAVVRVGTASASGTGSFISSTGLLMTNNHVLGASICPLEGCWINVAFQHQIGEERIDARTVFALPQHVDVGLDLAVVQLYDAAPSSGLDKRDKLDTPDFLTFDSFDAPSLVGQHVTIVGHPQAKLKKWSDGVVVDATGAWFEATNYILPGDSGSPVLNDKGHIVGLIHRGSSSVNLLTSKGVNLTSLGTASASLLQALDAPLPAVMIQTETSYSADFVVEHNEAYLNARIHTALVDGVSTDVISLLADACDEGLAATDYASPEELRAGLSPCGDAQGWIDCRAVTNGVGAPDPNVVCPNAADRALWAARFQAMNQRSVALNGQLDLGSITFGIAALAGSDAAGMSDATTSLQNAIAATKPLHDFDLAVYLAAFDVDTFETTKLIKGYRDVPHYEIYGSNIASAALWLNFNHEISSRDAFTILRALAGDPNISTGTKLYIEDVRYNSGDL